MNKKHLIWIIGIFLLVTLNLTYAVYPYGDNNNRTGNETCSSDAAAAVNWTASPTCLGNSFSTTSTTAEVNKYIPDPLCDPLVTGTTCGMSFNASVSACSSDYLITWTSPINDSRGLAITDNECGAGLLCIRNEQAGGATTITGWAEDGTNQNIKMLSNNSLNLYIFVNGTLAATRAWALNYEPRSFMIGGNGDSQCTAKISNIVFWTNSTNYIPDAITPPDTTPPKLNEINITSEGGLGQKINLTDPLCANAGCRVPRTNDTTPTLTANFSESSTAGLTDNRTQTYVQCTTTGTLVNICTESTELPVGLSNITLNWSDSSGNKNQTTFAINITRADINISLNEYANNTLIYNLYDVQFNFTVNFTDEIDKCSLYINNTFNQSNLSLITSNRKYNLTILGLSIRQDYKWNILCTTSAGLAKESDYYILRTDPTGFFVRITNGVNFTFRPLLVNLTFKVANLSCSGQNQTIGCLNLSISSPENLNFSLLWNITTDPSNQKIIDDFGISAGNWSVFQARSISTNNKTLTNVTAACAEIQSLNGSGLVEYRFNNSLLAYYLNSSNQTILINMTLNCTSTNYFTRLLNGTQKNRTGFDYLNFTWRGDATANRFNITLIDEFGTKVSSVSLNLLNPAQNSTGIALGALKNISVINITIGNYSGTSGLSGFFLDDLKLTNSTSSQSSNIKMYASCTGYYQNATRLPDKTLTNMCVVPANTTTKFIWLYQDINLTQKGIAWKLQYNTTIIG